jgi:hypothetical protein
LAKALTAWRGQALTLCRVEEQLSDKGFAKKQQAYAPIAGIIRTTTGFSADTLD